jgi:hypothetical protein
VNHYPTAPVCAAYDEPACGPGSVEPAKDAGAASQSDAGEPEVAPTPSHGQDPEDGFDAGIIEIDAKPVDKKSQVGCSAGKAPSGAGFAVWGVGALIAWGRRRHVRSRQVVEK